MTEFVERPGGQAATAMTACARLGWRARYVGRFGDDARGRRARASLEEEGVDVSACEDVRAPQPVSLILVDDEDRRTVLWTRAPPVDMAAGDVDPEVVTSGRVLLVDCHQTAAATRGRGVCPSVRSADDDRRGARATRVEALLTHIDLMITARTFPEAFTGVSGVGAALAALARRFQPALVCATLGQEGSLALVGGSGDSHTRISGAGRRHDGRR